MNALRSLAVAVALMLAGPAMAQQSEAGSEVGAIRVEQPWARASIGADRPGAAYLTITNTGTAPDRLVAVETPAAGMAEMHRSMIEGEVMKMEPVDALEIPPGATVKLAPGGMHLMLMHLASPLKKGSSFPLTLRFEQAGPVTIDVPVLGPGALGPE